jgi:hypothetical protein
MLLYNAAIDMFRKPSISCVEECNQAVGRKRAVAEVTGRFIEHKTLHIPST